MSRNSGLWIFICWVLISVVQSAAANEVVLKSIIGGHEIQIYDDFMWDYIQTEDDCYKGAGIGLKFCGLDKGWKIFDDRRNGIPPTFFNAAIGKNIAEGAIFGSITSDTQSAVQPIYTLQFTLEARAAATLGIQTSEINIVDFEDATVDSFPAITIAYDANVSDFPIEAVMTGWYIGNRLYRFTTMIQISGHLDELQNVHHDALALIKPID